MREINPRVIGGGSAAALAIPEAVRFTAAGLEIDEGLTEEGWIELGQFLRRSDDALTIWLADWDRYGTRCFGAERVRDAWVQLNFPGAVVTRAQLVAQCAVRSQTLTDEHHWVVGRMLEDAPKDQEKWLAAAQKHHLSPKQLARSIEANQIVRESAKASVPGGNLGIYTIQGIHGHFRIWERGVEANRPLEEWPLEELLAVREMLWPMVSFVDRVRHMIEERESVPSAEAGAGTAEGGGRLNGAPRSRHPGRWE